MSLENHSAPGPAAGYAFEFERALYLLALSPAGFRIGIETDDDVVVRHADGSLTLEQIKHSMQEDAKPFGDRSKDLWNTLSIWVTALEEGELDVGKTRFLMVTNKTLPDCIAKRISKAQTTDEISACMQELKIAALKPSETIRAYTEKVLATTSERSLHAVIENCELADAASGTSGIDLRKQTIAALPIPEWFTKDAESIANELLGWVKTQVLVLWQSRQAAWISRDSFVTQFHAVLDRRKRQKGRERAANLITVYDEQIGQEKGRNYVKQIHLVTDDDGRVDESIREYIMCTIEKTRLSADGNITDEDWIDFEETLRLRWRKISSREKRFSQGKPDEDVGFRILSETTDEHRERLAGIETEQVYLTAGTYHRLADRLEVGWHPRYKDLIKHKEKHD